MHNNIIGVPQQPEISRAVSPSPGVAVLDVNTNEAGIEDGEAIEFVVNTELISSGASNLFTREITNYEDSTITSLTINNLAPGVNYRFSVRVQNKFGVSEFSNFRELQIQASDSSSESTSIGKLHYIMHVIPDNMIIIFIITKVLSL